MNDPELDALRRAHATMLRERASHPPPALPVERLRALVDGDGDEADRLATLDAALTHPATARELELLRAFAANRPRSATARWRAAIPLLAAAALVAVAVPFALRSRATPGAPDTVRDGTPVPALLAPAEVATVEESRTFRWRAVPGARAYTLEILSAAGQVVFTTRTRDTTVMLATDTRLAPDAEYRWWVVGQLADGTQRRSPFRLLRVRAAK